MFRAGFAHENLRTPPPWPDLDQTRAVYGDQLDQVLVTCTGEAVCVARIGQKIGAAEVILIGIGGAVPPGELGIKGSIR